MQRLIAELKRRRVFRVAAAYVVVAFALLQAADLLIPALLLPAWTFRAFVLLVLLGFPVALALTWAFDITTRGVERTPPRTDAAPASAAAPAAGKRRVLAYLGVGLVVLLVGVAITTKVVQDRAPLNGDRSGAGALPPRDSVRRTSVAVLPFENLGSADDDYFAAGMTDEITTRLSQVSGFDVVPSRAAARYARRDRTLREIGQELGIEYVVMGSVRWAEASGEQRRIRVTLELSRVRDERQIWANTYDRLIDDVFEVQADIATQLVDRLGVTLFEPEQRRISARPARNHEAYTLYLKGRYFWNKRTEGDIQKALDHYQQAVDLDPAYALAWAGIADSWIFRGRYGHLAPRETFPKAKHAALQALRFDSTLAEAHTSLAHVHFYFDHDWEAAEREYLSAIRLDPDYPTAHHWYGGFLSAFGRHAEALQQAETARSLDPLSLIVQTWIGLRYYLAGQYDDAIEEYAKAIEMDSTFAPAHWHLSWAYVESGQMREAISEARLAVALDEQNRLYKAALAYAYARAGMRPEAEATLAPLLEAASTAYVSAYDVAAINIALGNTAAGLQWLERAFDEPSPWIGYMKVDPRLDPVRAQPRFIQLLGRAGLKPA